MELSFANDYAKKGGFCQIETWEAAARGEVALKSRRPRLFILAGLPRRGWAPAPGTLQVLAGAASPGMTSLEKIIIISDEKQRDLASAGLKRYLI
jgi:hypothetical protein